MDSEEMFNFLVYNLVGVKVYRQSMRSIRYFTIFIVTDNVRSPPSLLTAVSSADSRCIVHPFLVVHCVDDVLEHM
jgi:hypothetical protein